MPNPSSPPHAAHQHRLLRCASALKGVRPYAVFYSSLMAVSFLLYFAGINLSSMTCGEMYHSAQPDKPFDWRRPIGKAQAGLKFRMMAACKERNLTRPAPDKTTMNKYLLWQRVSATCSTATLVITALRSVLHLQ